MNYGLNFPIENYAALYISIIQELDTEDALRKVLPKEEVRYTSKAVREKLVKQAEALLAKGYSMNKAADALGVKRTTLIWWIRSKKGRCLNDNKN
ncbi:hypothetical protein [Phascolarctobacterium sp.]|uniref:hypothetical protein n=1 Tax=Phascolarctobacterium sp. TaxID=2049039 RepID=UPI00303CDB26